eukprot:1433910-Rhodomonas_salina.2
MEGGRPHQLHDALFQRLLFLLQVHGRLFRPRREHLDPEVRATWQRQNLRKSRTSDSGCCAPLPDSTERRVSTGHAWKADRQAPSPPDDCSNAPW